MPTPRAALLPALALLAATLPVPRLGRGADAATTPELVQSQISVEIDRGEVRRQFRATVVAKREESLTLLTAAHCLNADDVGGPARLRVGPEGSVLGASVQAVARNPAYREGPQREAPGADNAVVRLRVEPPAARSDAYRALRIIDVLADRPIPGPAGQTLAVRAFDAQGTEHAVRAGNYSNPRWLEWGPAYRPIPGDSGGGVFYLRRDPDGGFRPVLIGVVVERSDRGGGASLISRQQRWLAEALPR